MMTVSPPCSGLVGVTSWPLSARKKTGLRPSDPREEHCRRGAIHHEVEVVADSRGRMDAHGDIAAHVQRQLGVDLARGDE